MVEVIGARLRMISTSIKKIEKFQFPPFAVDGDGHIDPYLLFSLNVVVTID